MSKRNSVFKAPKSSSKQGCDLTLAKILYKDEIHRMSMRTYSSEQSKSHMRSMLTSTERWQQNRNSSKLRLMRKLSLNQTMANIYCDKNDDEFNFKTECNFTPEASRTRSLFRTQISNRPKQLEKNAGKNLPNRQSSLETEDMKVELAIKRTEN